MHLYWLWFRGPDSARGVTLGGAACGAKRLKPAEYTCQEADATCPACLASAAARLALPAASPTASPASGPRASPATGGPASPSPASGKARQRLALPGHGATIKALTPRNPRKPGTGKHERMALLLKHDGKTIQQFLDAGGNPETLANAIKEKLVETSQ